MCPASVPGALHCLFRVWKRLLFGWLLLWPRLSPAVLAFTTTTPLPFVLCQVNTRPYCDACWFCKWLSATPPHWEKCSCVTWQYCCIGRSQLFSNSHTLAQFCKHAPRRRALFVSLSMATQGKKTKQRKHNDIHGRRSRIGGDTTLGGFGCNTTVYVVDGFVTLARGRAEFRSRGFRESECRASPYKKSNRC